jgi:hypothetical protein
MVLMVYLASLQDADLFTYPTRGLRCAPTPGYLLRTPPGWRHEHIVEWLMIPIDHCLVSDDIRVIMALLGEPIGSDQLPLIIELEIEKPRETTAQQ